MIPEMKELSLINSIPYLNLHAKLMCLIRLRTAPSKASVSPLERYLRKISLDEHLQVHNSSKPEHCINKSV